MSCILGMIPTSVVAPRKVKIIKSGFSVFERGETLLQNGMLHFVFKFSEFTYTKNRLFWKKAWYLKEEKFKNITRNSVKKI